MVARGHECDGAAKDRDREPPSDDTLYGPVAQAMMKFAGDDAGEPEGIVLSAAGVGGLACLPYAAHAA
jgi:hypothetical protein